VWFRSSRDRCGTERAVSGCAPTLIAKNTLAVGFFQEYSPLVSDCCHGASRQTSRLLASIESYQATSNDSQDAYGEGPGQPEPPR
jgi:hypothetical protein